jgi:hypothetical protein
MQHRSSTYLALCTLALCAGALAFAPGGGKQDSQTCLVRPDSPPDGNAKGTLRIRSKGNSERFDVHIMKVEGGDEHHLWIEDPIDSDTFTDIGDLPGSGGSQKLALDTKKGDSLPLGVQTTDELIGRRVQIRHAGGVEQLSEHKGRYRRDCKKGEALPAGVMFVSELGGRRLQVRDGDGVVYLDDVLPTVQ